MNKIEDIRNTTYKDYIDAFDIYPSRAKARARGFEAHHIALFNG